MKRKILFILFLFLIIGLTTTITYADDYSDDIYSGDYSIEDMIRHFSIVTFGKQDYDPNMPYTMYKGSGSLELFHSCNNILVNGNVFNMKTLELRGGPSYVSGRIINPIEYWNTHTDGTIYAPESYNWRLYRSTTIGNYMNFDRLYNSVINEQQKIKKGRKLDANEFTMHIPTGGVYYIDDISSVHDIIFDNFEKNQNEITVITINNSGAINFPQLFRDDDYNVIPTNDDYRDSLPNYNYPSNYNYNTYYGNIVWNFPNAKYIRFSSGAPIVGHFIAPYADVEGPELHFAGTMLVNRLALAGNSESHFYPLTKNIPYKSSIDNYIARARVNPSMGNVLFNVDIDSLEEGMIVSFEVNAEENYELIDVKIEDDNGNIVGYLKTATDSYEFTMPAANVTVIPTFRELEKEPNPENEVDPEIVNSTEEDSEKQSNDKDENTIKEDAIDKILGKISNPETGDQIRKYISLGFVSLLLILIVYSIKKKYGVKKKHIQY